ECHLLQTTRNGVVVILDGLEDLRIRPKTNLGSGSTGVAAFLELFRDGVIKDLVPVLAVSLNFRFDAGRQRVNNGDTDAVQTTGDGIRVRVELTACVQLGHHDLDGRCTRGVHAHGDTAAIIGNFNAAVFHEANNDLGGMY